MTDGGEGTSGLAPWNKGVKLLAPSKLRGKSLSLEHRQKISEAHKGRLPWCTGKSLSPEHREKISKANLGKEAWNKGKSSWSRGKKLSAKHRENLSKAAKLRYQLKD